MRRSGFAIVVDMEVEQLSDGCETCFLYFEIPLSMLDMYVSNYPPPSYLPGHLARVTFLRPCRLSSLYTEA